MIMKRTHIRIAAATALGLGVSVLAATAPAQATTGPMNYDCTITSPITKTTPATVEYDTNMPARAYVGDPAMVLDLYGKGSIDSGTVNLAMGFPYSATSVQGNSEIPFSWNGATVNLTTYGDRVNLTKDKPADLSKDYSKVLTLPMPTKPGSYDLVFPKNYKSTNALYKSNGSQAAAPVASCVWKSGGTLVDQLEVWSKATTVLAGPQSLKPGASGQYTATISAPGTPVVDGTVSFTKDGVEFANVPVANGKAVATLPGNAVGDYQIGAVLQPTTARVEAAPVLAVPLSVGMVPTTTTLEVPAKMIEGETSVAKVKVSTPDGPAEGTVQVLAGGQTFEGTLLNGVAEVPVQGLPLGNHTIVATYVPADPITFGVSTSATLDVTVKVPPTATTTALSLDKTSGTAGDVVKATVTVAGATVPVGTVRVVIGGRSVSGEVDESGKVTVTLPPLPAGVHDVKAMFTPADPEAFGVSESGFVTLTLEAAANLAATAIDLAAVQSQVRAGEAIRVKVFVASTGAAGSPDELASGEANLTLTGQSLAGEAVNEKVSVVVARGKAEATLPLVAPGEYQVNAAFDPIGAFTDSETDTPVQVSVTRAPSTSVVTLDDASVTEGTPVVATVQVDSEVAPAHRIGEVTVSAGGVSGRAQLVDGQAQVSLAGLPVGTHQVTAVFTRGVASWVGSSNASSLVVTVAKAVPAEALPSTTVLTLLPATITQGDSSQAVAAVAGPQGLSGTVSFQVNGVTHQVPVVAGTATLSLAGLPVGTHPVTAAFAPADAAAVKPSTASPVNLTVRPAVAPPAVTTRTTVSVPAKVIVGQTFSATAKVTGATNGTVTFLAGGKPVKAAVANGTATARLTASRAGKLTVTAQFTPTSATTAASFAQTVLTVGPRASSTTVRAKIKKKANLVTLTAKVAGADCQGTVSYRVLRGAKSVLVASAPVRCNGAAQVTLNLPKKKGKYSVQAVFSGSAAVAGSSAKGAFKR